MYWAAFDVKISSQLIRKPRRKFYWCSSLRWQPPISRFRPGAGSPRILIVTLQSGSRSKIYQHITTPSCPWPRELWGSLSNRFCILPVCLLWILTASFSMKIYPSFFTICRRFCTIMDTQRQMFHDGFTAQRSDSQVKHRGPEELGAKAINSI